MRAAAVLLHITKPLGFHIQFLKINLRRNRQRRSKFKPLEAKEEVRKTARLCSKRVPGIFTTGLHAPEIKLEAEIKVGRVMDGKHIAFDSQVLRWWKLWPNTVFLSFLSSFPSSSS